jgi:hypothetical protein
MTGSEERQPGLCVGHAGQVGFLEALLPLRGDPKILDSGL